MKKILLTAMLLLSACENTELKVEAQPAQPKRTVCQIIRDNNFSQMHPEGWTAYCVGEVDAKLDAVLKELHDLKQRQH